MKKLALLLSICIIINQTNVYAISPLPVYSNQSSIATILQSDGTLDLSKNFQGSLNLNGFNVQLDECKGIIATPKSKTSQNQCVKEEAINSTWSPLISSGGINGVGDMVFALAIDGNNNIYVGGLFTTLGDGTTPANRVAKWDGTNWSALISSNSINGVGNIVWALQIDGNNNVYVGGQFTTLGDGTTPANRVAKWDGTNWSALTSSSAINGVGNTVYAIDIDGSNNVYIGGNFITLGDGTTAAHRIVKWDGTNWSALTSSNAINGVGGRVWAIEVDGNNVYVGGDFTTLGDAVTIVNYVTKWDGSNWSALISSSGVNGLAARVLALKMDNTNNLYIGGNFANLSDLTPGFNFIVKWDGSNWSALGVGFSSSGVSGLLVDGSNNLYVNGGFYSLADGITTVNFIAKWDGTSWSTLGSGLNTGGGLSGLALGTDGLYVGSAASMAGGVVTNYVAKWDGVALPVELSHFNVESSDGSHLLFWNTSTEKNNEGFTIQRSTNGHNWQNIGFVQGKGTTQDAQNYSFTDEAPSVGINYYRLKQADFDEKFEYSKIVSLEYNQSNYQEHHQLEIYPNPVIDELTIINGKGTLIIYNLLGQAVETFNIQNQSAFKINTSDLSTGQYILHLQKENHKIK